MKCDKDKLTMLASSIAIELTRGKTPEELALLRIILNQIYNSVCTIIGLSIHCDD